MHDINSMSRGNVVAETQYHAQLGLADKGLKSNGWFSAIIGM